MNTKNAITNKLREAFTPESLDVTDESHLHEGHAGHRPGGETHFRVYIGLIRIHLADRRDTEKLLSADEYEAYIAEKKSE